MAADAAKRPAQADSSSGNGLPPLSRPLIPIGIRYCERQDNPPPGLCWYRVREQDTLASIASRYSLTWMDLCLLNFGTVDLGQVNWYLRHWVGCSRHNQRWYLFTGEEDPGMLLVPEPFPKQEPFDYIDEPGVLYAVSGESVHVDLGRGIEVFEQCRNGGRKQPEGKWLYVFSAPGLHFNYQLLRRTDPAPSGARRRRNDPGSAFTGLFMRNCLARGKKPDRLECEIYITPQSPPTAEHMAYIGGDEAVAALRGPERYRRAWYTLSGANELKDALNQPRGERDRHGFSSRRNLHLPYCDTPRCYYFLLSPLQLGPSGLASAMARPDALTPLIDPDLQERHWNENGECLPVTAWQGPDLTGASARPLSICVVDPYAWAESIAVDLVDDTIGNFRRWIEKGKVENADQLLQTTGWTPEIFGLACLLETVRSSHPEPDRLNARLGDAKGFSRKLARWHKSLAGPVECFSARLHCHLAELDAWLRGPAHAIIDTALRDDTDNGRVEDWLDVAWGLHHCQICLEPAQMTAPGGKMIERFLKTPGGLLSGCLNLNSASRGGRSSEGEKRPEKIRLAMRYAHAACMRLMGLDLSIGAKPLAAGRESFSFREQWRKSANFLHMNQLVPGAAGVAAGLSGIVLETEENAPGQSLSGAAPDKVVLAGSSIGPSSARAKWTAAAIEARLKTVARMVGHSGESEQQASFPWLPSTTLAGLILLNCHGLIRSYKTYGKAPAAPTVWELVHCELPAARDIVYQGLSENGYLPGENAKPGGAADRCSRLCSLVSRAAGNRNAIDQLLAGIAAAFLAIEDTTADHAVPQQSAAACHAVTPATPAAGLLAVLAAPAPQTTDMGPACISGTAPLPARMLLAELAAASALANHGQNAFADAGLAVWAEHSFFGAKSNRHPHRPWSPSGKFRLERWPLEQQRAAWWNLAGRFRLVFPLNERQAPDRWRCQLIAGLLFDGCQLEIAIKAGNDDLDRALFRLPDKKPLSPDPDVDGNTLCIDLIERDETGYRSIVFSCNSAETIQGLQDATLSVSLRFPGEKSMLGCKCRLPGTQSTGQDFVKVAETGIFMIDGLR